MTDVAGIRNARVALARRFDAAPPLPGVTFAGLAFPEPRKAYGRSYANRTVPIPRVKSKLPPARKKWVAEGAGFTVTATWTPIPTGAPPDSVPIEYGSLVSLRLFDFKVVSVYVSRLFGQCSIHVDFTVPERVTGNPLTLTYNHAILPNATKHYMAEQTGIAISKAFEHEIRERLYLGAKHFVDPHPEASAVE